MVRLASYFLIGAGICLLVLASYDQGRGITGEPLRIQAQYDHSESVQPVSESKASNPKLFREYMTTHWIRAFAVVGVGSVLWALSAK